MEGLQICPNRHVHPVEGGLRVKAHATNSCGSATLPHWSKNRGTVVAYSLLFHMLGSGSFPQLSLLVSASFPQVSIT